MLRECTGPFQPAFNLLPRNEGRLTDLRSREESTRGAFLRKTGLRWCVWCVREETATVPDCRQSAACLDGLDLQGIK